MVMVKNIYLFLIFVSFFAYISFFSRYITLTLFIHWEKLALPALLRIPIVYISYVLCMYVCMKYMYVNDVIIII